jgi:hypothetical protein
MTKVQKHFFDEILKKKGAVGPAPKPGQVGREWWDATGLSEFHRTLLVFTPNLLTSV